MLGTNQLTAVGEIIVMTSCIVSCIFLICTCR